jgi:hypothetical protein
VLQEDNDSSHGHTIPQSLLGATNTLAGTYRSSQWVEIITHPPQSPDLNPIEACWNIIKQRIRHKVWNDIEELKQALQDEWTKVTIQKIRARIAEMPNRCESLVNSGGKAIKSELW